MSIQPTEPTTNQHDDEHTLDATRPVGQRATSDLRQLDEHASYREVYYACGVEGVGHE